MSDDLKKLLETANSNVAKADALIADLKQDVAAVQVDNTDAHADAVQRDKERAAYIQDHPELIVWKTGG